MSNMSRANMSRARILRLVFALSIIPFGAVLVLLVIPGPVGQLISGLGLALIVSGVASAFREIAILRLESEETGESIAERVHKRLLAFPPGTTGIRMVSRVRKGYDGYSVWAVKTGPQDLFFAGRSVLHRVDFDLKMHGFGAAEEVIARRLAEGASIRIMFVDPRLDLIERLAKEEGQTKKTMLSDIATTIGVCRRIYDLLRDSRFSPSAQLHIRVYDEVPYFAYHKEDEKVLVGFYFTSALGMTGVFEVMDDEIKKLFDEHFTAIYNRAAENVLLQLLPQSDVPLFNEDLNNKLYMTLVNNLGKERTDQLISGSVEK